MQGIKQRSPKLFYPFSLEEAVPADHPWRRLARALDLSFLYPRTRGLYGTDGQKSIDPVVFFKICLLGYLNNITSDRGLVRYCSDSLAGRWFVGYDIDEPLPAHSTLSRTRALFGRELYEQVFRAVLSLCVDAGLVAGKRQVVDSALIKANASLDSMQRRVILEDAGAWCRQVAAENAEEAKGSGADPGKQVQTSRPTPVELPAEQKKPRRRRSNKTHASVSDPDARMARKPGKPTAMYYHGQISVDDQCGVITAGMADYADREDHQSLPGLLEQVQTHLSGHQLRLEELVGDSKYNTLHSIQACQQAGVTAYMPNPSGYKRHREGFVYEAATDSYRCSQGVSLPFKRWDKNRGKYLNKVYQSTPADCAGCPLRGDCLSGKATYKTLTHSSGKALYDQMDDRLQGDYGRRVLAKRAGVVEPVIGNLIHHNGMKNLFSRGLAAADKHVLMASAAFNLKKWLKNRARGPLRKATAIGNRLCQSFLAAAERLDSMLGKSGSRRRHQLVRC